MSDRDRATKPLPLPYRHELQRISPSAVPTVAEVKALHAPAAKVVTDLLGIHEQQVEATRVLIESRFGGSLWHEAEAADRRAVLDGAEPTEVAALLAAEPTRYGRALALSGTAAARFDSRRAAGAGILHKTATEARKAATEAIDNATALARDGWQKRDTARGLAAIEQAEEERDRAERLLAIADWCDGSAKVIAKPGETFVPIPDDVTGILAAAAYDRRGSVPLNKDPRLPADWVPRYRGSSLSA